MTTQFNSVQKASSIKASGVDIIAIEPNIPLHTWHIMQVLLITGAHIVYGE